MTRYYPEDPEKHFTQLSKWEKKPPGKHVQRLRNGEMFFIIMEFMHAFAQS